MVGHNAIYFDRTYDGALFLQSIDRIHRLGLSPDAMVSIHIFRSTIDGLPTIDHLVEESLQRKEQQMRRLLEGAELAPLAQHIDPSVTADGDEEDLGRTVALSTRRGDLYGVSPATDTWLTGPRLERLALALLAIGANAPGIAREGAVRAIWRKCGGSHEEAQQVLDILASLNLVRIESESIRRGDAGNMGCTGPPRR